MASTNELRPSTAANSVSSSLVDSSLLNAPRISFRVPCRASWRTSLNGPVGLPCARGTAAVPSRDTKLSISCTSLSGRPSRVCTRFSTVMALDTEPSISAQLVSEDVGAGRTFRITLAAGATA